REMERCRQRISGLPNQPVKAWRGVSEKKPAFPLSGARTGRMSGMLTTEQLLKAVDEVAAASLPLWGLGGAELTLINHSENWTYRVLPKNAARPVILRVHREGYHSIDGIRSELAW